VIAKALRAPAQSAQRLPGTKAVRLGALRPSP